MHELALAQSICDIIGARATADGFERVLKVHLRIGALAHVDPEALTFGFSAVSRGTVAEAAEIVIERPPGQAFCVPCGENVEVARRSDPCPRCGRHQWLLVDGDDMQLTELEVE